MKITDLTISDWLAIASVVGATISFISAICIYRKKKSIETEFGKQMESYKHELAKSLESKKLELSQILEMHKATLAKEAVRNQMMLEKRVEIMRDTLKRLDDLKNIVCQLASYNGYECKTNLKYTKDEICEYGKCQERCILNYYEFVCALDEKSKETLDYLNANQYLYTLSDESIILQYIGLTKQLANESIKICTDYRLTEREKALLVFEKFSKFDIMQLMDFTNKLVEHFRQILGVPMLSEQD